MGEGTTLFTSGFLGATFSWWVGQIVDDSFWRDNIAPGKHDKASQIPGWGRRYKVRIIGFHDQEDAIAEPDQLPWAQVMYPVTSGGYLGNSSSTPGLKQGNIVFGFFMDQQDQQIPVIMGVLGHDAQAKLYYTQGDDRVTDEKCGSILTSGSAKREIPQEGTTPVAASDVDKFVAQQATGNKNAEAVSSPQLTNVSDSKRHFDQKIKHVLLSPCNPNQSSLKGIQTSLDNLMNYIDAWLSTITAYADAAAAIISSLKDMESMLERIACEIAKYLKIIMDKIMEYTLKMLNKSLVTAVAAIPSTMRNMFGDVKEIVTELLVCLYNKITDSMCDMIADLLKDAFPLKELEERAKEAARNDEDGDNRTAPYVPICYAR